VGKWAQGGILLKDAKNTKRHRGKDDRTFPLDLDRSLNKGIVSTYPEETKKEKLRSFLRGLAEGVG